MIFDIKGFKRTNQTDPILQDRVGIKEGVYIRKVRNSTPFMRNSPHVFFSRVNKRAV